MRIIKENDINPVITTSTDRMYPSSTPLLIRGNEVVISNKIMHINIGTLKSPELSCIL
jgi:hypothetical protein